MSAQSEVALRLAAVCNVSRETVERLEHLVAAVEKWSPAINLVADSRPTAVWERHVLDSAQIVPLAPRFANWCDLGSGGGFPGLVIAAISRERSPEAHITLVESDRRKATFLSLMARELSLNVHVHPARAEDLAPQAADVVSARALAPLVRLLEWVARHAKPGGTALLPKGRAFEEEIAAARRRWAFTVDAIPSIVSPDSRILRVTDLRSSHA
jgi:16S rRNA (guanine527-N7)-methyltransferase